MKPSFSNGNRINITSINKFQEEFMKPTSVCSSSNYSDRTMTQMPLICSFHVFPTILVEKTRLWEWLSILEPWRKLLKYFVCHTIQWLITTAHRCTSQLHTHAYIKELYDLFLDTSSLVHIIVLQFDSEVDLNWRMERKLAQYFVMTVFHWEEQYIFQFRSEHCELHHALWFCGKVHGWELLFVLMWI